MNNPPIQQVSEYWRDRYHKSINLVRWMPYCFITEGSYVRKPPLPYEDRDTAEETTRLITHWLKGSSC